ncbi:chloride channel protein [Companilactobacillus sp. RD055328]|nr:chloride channel protein [Companilactobacillus sp. RD055328]
MNFSGYPILIGITGGLLIGITQMKFGNYPKTMHETLREYKQKGSVEYRGEVIKNFIPAIIVLSFGASLGPEAALISILGGLITWIGDSFMVNLKNKEELLDLGIGAMLATIFHAPFISLGEAVEEGVRDRTFKNKSVKTLLYVLTTFFGIVGFKFINNLFPKEAVFSLRMPKIQWSLNVIPVLIIAFLIGIIFSILFTYSEKLTDLVAKKINNPLVLAIAAGLAIGIMGMFSSYFLFSGEHEILHLSKHATQLSVVFLLILGIGKIILTNICFSFGWRGGKIFPIIFASSSIGFAITNIFPYTPGLVVGVVVATSCTMILKQPFVIFGLLIFLFPLQFAPIILITCLLADVVNKQVENKKS